jgi:hypothetical protein
VVLAARGEGIRLALPSKLPVSPMTLSCPLCNAQPGQICRVPSRRFQVVVHVERIKAALVKHIEAKTVPAQPELEQKVTRIPLGKRAILLFPLFWRQLRGLHIPGASTISMEGDLRS